MPDARDIPAPVVALLVFLAAALMMLVTTETRMATDQRCYRHGGHIERVRGPFGMPDYRCDGGKW